jgi:glucose/mannose transport system substrate-binding protein
MVGLVEPVDFIWNRYGLKKVIPKQLISQITYRGRLYSVPVNIHRANILWYNPAVLRKARIASPPKTWAQFIAALKKAKSAGVIPLAVGEQWTQKHLLETVMIGKLGPAGWSALWKKGANWNSPNVKAAPTTRGRGRRAANHP